MNFLGHKFRCGGKEELISPLIRHSAFSRTSVLVDSGFSPSLPPEGRHHVRAPWGAHSVLCGLLSMLASAELGITHPSLVTTLACACAQPSVLLPSGCSFVLPLLSHPCIPRHVALWVGWLSGPSAKPFCCSACDTGGTGAHDTGSAPGLLGPPECWGFSKEHSASLASLREWGTCHLCSQIDPLLCVT